VACWRSWKPGSDKTQNALKSKAHMQCHGKQRFAHK
jgi:hypothetical protein